jgi:hypothetical protein
MFGFDAGGASGTDGASRNSFFGSNAGQQTSGNDNVFVGYRSGQVNLAGAENTFVGSETGPSNNTGSSNTLVGARADVAHPTLTNATAIGARALVGQDNSIVLGSIADLNGATHDTKVGIGIDAPVTKLHVREGHLYIDSANSMNALFGVILKSPDGTCWKITVSDAGALVTTSIACPSN